jgi:amino acid adenylation domain-containing protein
MSPGGVHALVEAQAARTPAATAVVCGDDVWSFARLDEAANRVARGLCAQGVGRGAVVAVHLAPSPWLPAAVLGVWKAGAAYLALDSPVALAQLRRLAPPDRPRAVIHFGQHPELPGVPGLDLADLPAGGVVETVPVAAQDAAYVAFSSGSSSRPKGIVGTHAGVIAYFESAVRAGYLTGTDTVVQLTAASFDASLRDMILPLVVGARTVVATEGGRDPGAAVALMAATGATVIPAVVPSLLRELVREAARGHLVLDRVRLVLVSGERLHPRDAPAARAVFPRARVINMYGPSETTMTATAHEVGAGDREVVPIGRPLPHICAYVLDPQGRPVPPGRVGELHLGGAGITRGYWNRAGLTAERFVPNPFGKPGDRLYRTGDRVKARLDGELEFVGRLDDQVKIRGQRVHLGEVESALLELSGVHAAACATWEPEQGETTLVAYLAASWRATPGELRSRLAGRLPDAMLPAVVVELADLPRTTSGKIDRRALPTPCPTGRALTGPPRTELERELAAVWCEVLGVPGVGRHDTFFDLGGHSLLAMRLVARMIDVFGVQVPLRVLFDSPTVAAVATYLAEARVGQEHSAQPPARRRERLLSPSQDHLWRMERIAPGSPCLNVAGIVRFPGDLAVDALERAMTEIVRRHDGLRMVFPDSDGAPVAVVLPAEPVSLAVTDLGDSDATTVRAAVRDLSRQGFDLAHGPLVRATALRVAPDEHLLVIVGHHIVFDGWSMANVYRELTALYRAYAAGRRSPLPEVALQYPDFATWQAEQLAAGAWAEDIAFWRSRLAGASPLVELPDGYPFTDPEQRHRGQRATMLDVASAGRLTALAGERGATLTMLLLAAFQAALRVVTGAERFHVATPLANRAQPERADMIGFVANTVLLRADLADDPTFATVLERARSAVLDGYAHAEAPLEAVLAEILPGPRTPDLRLAQAMFNMQDMPALGVHEAAPEPTESADGWARYPIALFVTRSSAGCELVFVYDSTLFTGDWAAAVLAGVCRFLDAPFEARLSEFALEA